MSTCPPPGADVHPRDSDPEPVGPIADRVLDDLAARQAEALNRLRRQKPAYRSKETR